MPFTFPSSPSVGDTSTQNGRTYRWTGYTWDVVASYTLPIAGASTLGAVQVGSGLAVDGSGVLSVSSSYTLPNATSSTLGGVIVGTGLGVSSGTISVSYGTSAGTACQGNDSRLSDSRAPSGSAGGDLTGTYPNPQIAAGAIVTADIADTAITNAKLASGIDASKITTGTLPAARLPSTTVTGGAYGSASSVATFTVGADGRLTAAGSTSIAISSGAVSGLAASATTDTTNASNIGSGTLSASRLPTSGVSAGTYTSVTVDTYGRVTAGTNPSAGKSLGLILALQ